MQSTSLPEALRNIFLNCISSGSSHGLARPPSFLHRKVLLQLNSVHQPLSFGTGHSYWPCGLGLCVLGNMFNENHTIHPDSLGPSLPKCGAARDFLLFSVFFFFYCKIRHSFEFMCVLKNQPCFHELRLAPQCGCWWMWRES